jgi:predicted MPP superfamily phosphohydrolase
LNGNCQIISVGNNFKESKDNNLAVISIISPFTIHNLFSSTDLELIEYQHIATLTRSNIKVMNYAKTKKILCSMIYAYINNDEQLINFGSGGSESMTMFVIKDQNPTKLIVKKILSEALITAKWDPLGKGEMLPPFAKAKKQAEFLLSLPDSVAEYFPKVFDIIERDIPVPLHQQKNNKLFYKELIYEMSYIKGIEISRFVEKYSPAPIIIAKLYSLIFQVLKEKIHTVNITPSPGNTLETSYFKKIEARLNLSKQTAPKTFNSNLLDNEKIIINGNTYYNYAYLLNKFRTNPDFLNILEPKYHSIVMGDTNTENIKINNLSLLLHIQKLIDEQAPQIVIQQALDEITSDSLGIMFLDPRAIGFQSDGSKTIDDIMYDNKPWHNSLGHYDEIHGNYFNLKVQIEKDCVPKIDILFDKNNPFQRSYKVRDIIEKGGNVNTFADASGMEDYFASIMASIYQDDPYWLIRFIFIMGTHFTAMPSFHFQAEIDGTLVDTYDIQKRPVAIYCEGIKWLNLALEFAEGKRTEFLGVKAPSLPYLLNSKLSSKNNSFIENTKITLNSLSNESRIIATPWSRLVRGIGLGQYVTNYNPIYASHIKKSFKSLLDKVLPENTYTLFSSLLTNLILNITNPNNEIASFDIERAIAEIISVIQTESNPYWCLTAGCILIDTVVKLDLDRSLLIKNDYDFPNELLAIIDKIQPNKIKDENIGKHGDYEKISAFTTLFLSFGQLNIQQRLIKDKRNYIIESLNTLAKIPSPFFRGRGGSMLMSAILLIGFGSFIFDERHDYMAETLDYLDKADQLNNSPTFPQPMSAAFSKCYPLLTMLNTIAISGKHEYLSYGKDRLVEAKRLFKKLSSVEQTHMGLYYIIALNNLDLLEKGKTNFDQIVENIISQWKVINPGENYFLHGISYSYIIETAMITNRLDLISPETIDRLIEAFVELDKNEDDCINRPYPFGYALNALGEIGMSEKMFIPHIKYAGKSPINWIISKISCGGRKEGSRLYILNHALINYALRFRNKNNHLDLFSKFLLAGKK